MYTIAALGNPGEEYRQTRHNAARAVMDEVVKAWGWDNSFRSVKLSGEVFEGSIGGQSVRVVYPDTYMNDSGGAVKKALDETPLNSLIIAYDDVDLPFGEFKLAYGRGAGGHNGLKSVIESLDTPDFVRVRIGIAPVNWLGTMVRPQGDRLSDYVLGNLTNRESNKLRSVAPGVKRAIERLIEAGRAAAMNEFN